MKETGSLESTVSEGVRLILLEWPSIERTHENDGDNREDIQCSALPGRILDRPRIVCLGKAGLFLFQIHEAVKLSPSVLY